VPEVEMWALSPVQSCPHPEDDCLRVGLTCRGCLGNGLRLAPDPVMVKVVMSGPNGRPIVVDTWED
jgi:hypothetical protein